MAGQGSDELEQGREPRSRAVPRWLASAGIVVLVVVGVVAVLHDDGSRGAAPLPQPSASSTSGPSSLNPEFMITTSQDVCTRTDHRRLLTVSFGLVNLSSERVLVRDVTPLLPLGGLRLTNQSIGLASCRQVFGVQQTRVLDAGRSLVVLFNFALPKDCPQPLPVEAEVTVSRADGSHQVREPVHILSDLGGLEFDQC